jgi:pilus assembly protein CpaB
MSLRNIVTILVAIVLGLGAVLLARSYLRTAPAGSATATLNTSPVVLAAKDIERGALLSPEMLKIANFPADAVPASAFHSIAEVASSQRLALRALAANTPVLLDEVSGAGGKLNLSGVLHEGMRAVSLRSNDVAGVGGFVLPGDHVDVMLTRTVGSGEKSDTITNILAEDVLVLGVDQSANDQAHDPVVAKAITVEVTPDQAQSISLGQSVGTVSLSLRHPTDDAPLARQSMSTSDLGGTAPRRTPPAHRRSGSTGGGVQIFRGMDSSTVQFGTASGVQKMAKSTGVVSP